MAEERVIKILAETGDAEKKIETLGEKFDRLSKKANDLKEEIKKATTPEKKQFLKKELKEVEEQLGKTGESATKAKKKVGLLSKGFKTLGTTIKATGIGLVVSLVASLGVAFSKNQRFIDAFNTVTETASIILSQVVSALISVYDSVSQNTENFDALGKVLKGVLTVSVTPLKLAFFGIKLGIQQAQLSWEKSFFGGKDKDKIKELTLGILETKEAIFDTGKDAIDASKNIYNNFSEAITETGEIAKKTQTELSKVSIKNAKLQAENIVKLQKASELAEAKLAGLTLKYQNEAELQRQIRDDVRLSIEERIQANDRLGKILEEQTKEELKLANQKLSLAKAQLDVDPKRIENQVAYQNALNEVADVEERINGQKSEQIVNEAALLDERKANLQELQNIGKTEQELAKQEALSKYENQKTLIERTVSDEKQKNQLLLNAKKEYNNTLDEIDKDHQSKIDEILEVTKEKEKETLVEKLELEKERKLLELDELKATEQQKADIIKFYDEKITKTKKDEAKKRFDFEKETENATISLKENTLNLLNALSKRGSALAKGLAIAEVVREQIKSASNTIQSTIAANAKAVAASPLTAGQPFVGINTASAGIGIASGIATATKSIQSILSENKAVSSGGSVGSTGGGATQQPSAPSFNLVQGTGSNQIAQTVAQQNQQPVKAYVVGSDVTTQQQLDRNKIDASSI